MGRVLETFRVFLVLGLTSFGGPIAHLGYFHTEFVTRRKWLDDASYADLVALCQFLPGPASSQVGFAIGYRRAGLAGAFAAFIAFTAPSVIILWLVWLGAARWNGALAQGILHGLKLAAVAVVAQAIWQMSVKLTPDWPRRALAVAAAAVALLVPGNLTPLLIIAAAGALGAMRPQHEAAPHAFRLGHHPAALACLAAFAALLVVLPVLAAGLQSPALDIADRFYRTGSLVFGGGHVVLPLLERELVAPGLVTPDMFLAGYGAAQAVPGPLFSFAFFAGAALKPPPNGFPGGLLALAAIYLPSFLLVLGALPYWTELRTLPRLRAALDFANAAVLGLLLAALVTPIIPAAIGSPLDIALAVVALGLLLLRLPPWVPVLALAVATPLLMGW